MTNVHTHKKSDELAVYLIPADTDHPMEVKVIENNWQAMSKLVGGYIEVARSGLIPDLDCGCSMVMVVNEEGLIYQLPFNLRASIYYPSTTGLRGDVFLVGQGLVEANNPEDDLDPDFFTLPQGMNKWEGPGNPLPAQTQPWELRN